LTFGLRRLPNPAKSVPVKIAISPALNSHLKRLVGFGWGNDVADVMRSIVIGEVRRLQELGRLPDEPSP